MTIRTLFLVIFVLLTSACARITPINNLALPPVSIIEGKVTDLDKRGFILVDNSGAIHVRATLPDHTPVVLSPGERIKVYGNLLAGSEKEFDAYVIRKSTHEQIIVSKPSPHLGFILQTSFD